MTEPKAPKASTARPVPAALAELALLDIKDVSAVVRMSDSWIYAELAAARFPAPVIRESRCTRWRSADISSWLMQRVTPQPQAEKVIARAKKASAAAQAKRLALATQARS